MSGALAPASPSAPPGGPLGGLSALLQSALVNALQPPPPAPQPTPLQRFSQNLQDFGASLSTAANARGPGGFLTYGQGFAGPLGAGILGTQQAQQQRAALQSQLGLQGAQTGNVQAQTALARASLPMELMRFQMMMNGMQANPFTSGAAPATAQPLGGTAQGIAAVESGGNPQAQNAGGYLGEFQFGTAAANAAGLYTPAKGEDLTKNQWTGTWTIPGFDPMTPDQFAQNPQAQKAAYNQAQGYLTDQANKLGLGQYIGKNVGGVTMTPGAIISGMWIGGPTGMRKFLASGGQYDPADANGTTISDYVQRTQAAQPKMPGTSFVPPGMMTPSQAVQRAQQLRAQAYAYSWINPTASAGLNQEAQQLESYAYGSLAPQRGYAGGYTITANGVTRSGTPTTIKNPDGSETRAVEFPPVIDQNGVALPGYIQPLTLQGAAGPGTPARPSAAPTFRSPMIGFTPAATAAASAGLSVPPTPPQNGALAELSPTQEEFLKGRGEGLSERFNAVDTAAANAVNSNYLFDNMRRDSQTWQMGKFAEWKNDAKAYLQSIATSLGGDPKQMNLSLSDFQAFNKSAGMLLRQAVHETSSRAAVQEYRMIGSTLPTPENTAQAFGQIADQWQGLNDYNIAKQSFARRYLSNPEAMEPTWDQNVSPTAFLMRRMMQTQSGQQDFEAATARMAKTPEGRRILQGMFREYDYADSQGLFQGLPN